MYNFNNKSGNGHGSDLAHTWCDILTKIDKTALEDILTREGLSKGDGGVAQCRRRKLRSDKGTSKARGSKGMTPLEKF